jgi:hypothetical protein
VSTSRGLGIHEQPETIVYGFVILLLLQSGGISPINDGDSGSQIPVAASSNQ